MMRLFLLVLAACAPLPDELDLDAPVDPSWPTIDDQLPPPGLGLEVSLMREGQTTMMFVTGAMPGEMVRLGMSAAGYGSGPCPSGLGGQCLGLLAPVQLIGKKPANGHGNALWTPTVPHTPNSDLCFQAAVVRPSGSLLSDVVCHTIHPDGMAQPGQWDDKDIWTTNTYSYAPGGGGPGGGLDNEYLIIGGWGDTYHTLLEFDLSGLPPVATLATLELYADPAETRSATDFVVDYVTSPWDWKTTGTGSDLERLWWADHPSYSSGRGPFSRAAGGTWQVVDITDLYNDWQSGVTANHGVVIRPMSTWNTWAKWHSAENLVDPALRPRIVVQ